MKHLFWSDPNERIEIIEATAEAMDAYGHRCGSDKIMLTKEHIEALQSGKCLAWNDSEYSTFVVLNQ